MGSIIQTWKTSLDELLRFYEAHRPPLIFFYPLLFLFFVILNVGCYWLAMYTAFPFYMETNEAREYFLLQFPVGFLGAVFDSLSFFVTIWIIRRALKCQSAKEYVGHLSLDVFIAVIATFWVLFVFTWGGQLVSSIDAIFTETIPETMGDRTEKTQLRVQQAIQDPVGNWRNIYFGLIMGISASLPTCTHFLMFFGSCLRSLLPGKPGPGEEKSSQDTD